MDYDIERKRQEEKEIRKAFREIFPLADETDLPWAPCHIKNFLRDRVRRETEERMHHFQSRVVRVLCDISPPKSHVDDMARIVVDECKAARHRVSELEKEIEDWRREALLALAGIVPTPLEGYTRENGGHGRFRTDAQKARAKLKGETKPDGV